MVEEGTEVAGANFKTIKITQPMYVGTMAPLIQDYFQRLYKNKGVRGISYETLYGYFTQIVQYGGDKAELWAVIDDKNKPVAFAVWKVPALPQFGIAHCDHIFNSNGNQKTMSDLVEMFIDFGARHKAPYYTFRSVNQKTGSHFVKIASKHKLNFETTGMEGFIGRVEP